MAIIPDYTNIFFLSMGAFGIGLGFVMCLGQLVVRRKSPINYLLSSLFFLLALILLYLHSVRTGWMYRNPYWFYALFPSVFLLAPVLRWIAIVAMAEKIESIRQEFYLILPGCLSLFIPFIAFAMDRDRLRNDMESVFLSRGFHLWDVMLALGLGYILFFLGIILSKFYIVFQWNTLKRERVTGILAFMIVATCIHGSFSLGYILFKSWWMIEVISTGIVCYLITAYMIGHRVPEFFQRVQEVAIEEKVLKSKSQLEGINLESIHEGLIALMDKDKLYREEDLTLSDLATELAYSVHQVSEYLNRHLGKNFAQFVNEYRVREAEELLLANREKTVLEIALSVGFGTKSSFHRAFMKYAGMTPSDWRMKNPYTVPIIPKNSRDEVADYNLGRQDLENPIE